MEIDGDLMGMFAGFSGGELRVTREVCKVISYYYFDKYRREKAKPVKVKLDAMCEFISHLELILKQLEKEVPND